MEIRKTSPAEVLFGLCVVSAFSPVFMVLALLGAAWGLACYTVYKIGSGILSLFGRFV